MTKTALAESAETRQSREHVPADFWWASHSILDRIRQADSLDDVLLKTHPQQIIIIFMSPSRPYISVLQLLNSPPADTPRPAL